MRSAPRRDDRARLAAAALLAVAAALLTLGAPGNRVARSGANLTDTETVAAGALGTRAACTTPNAYAAAVTALGPTFYWRFSETAGATTVADASGGGNGGRVVTGPAPVTLGAASSGLVQCDDLGLTSPSMPAGSPSGSFVVRTAPDRTRSTFTISAWVRTTSATGGRIIGQGDSATGLSTFSDRMLFLDDSGHAVFAVYRKSVGYALRSTMAVNDGRPHLLAASMGAAGATLYVDGVPDRRNLTLTKADAYPGNQGYWRVGWDNLAGWGALTPTDFGPSGGIDEAAVFQGIQLTDAQVAGLWAANHW